MSRTFNISPKVRITLHEPSLTGDHLGLKTWTSSLLLAKRRGDLDRPTRHRTQSAEEH